MMLACKHGMLLLFCSFTFLSACLCALVLYCVCTVFVLSGLVTRSLISIKLRFTNEFLFASIISVPVQMGETVMEICHISVSFIVRS